MFSEYWLTRHNRLIGLTPQKPFEIAYAREHSVFWRATEETSRQHRRVFPQAETISSRRRARWPALHHNGCSGDDARKRSFRRKLRGVSLKQTTAAEHRPAVRRRKSLVPRSGDGPGFLENNFLSNDKRYPLTKIETNSARAFGTNAKAGHVWDNFSSLTYKELSPVDELEFFNPFDETHPIKFKPKEKNVAPGYYRVPSLVSVWSSAPLLHNNTLGKFTGDPSIAGRIDAFNDAIEKLLWPEKRLNKDSIWRTQNECTLHLRKEFVPKPLQHLAGNDGYISIGPIPKGVPINLIGNLEPDLGQLVVLQAKIVKALVKIHAMNLSPEEATAELTKAVPELLAANKCPDFIEDKGHYFGTDLPDSDKRALIEYLKTF